MTDGSGAAAQNLVDHLKRCRGVKAAVVGDTGVDMTPTVESMLAAGWTYGGVEYIGGKRIRYLLAPRSAPGSEPTCDCEAFEDEHPRRWCGA